MSTLYGVDLPLEAYVFHRWRPQQLELPMKQCFYPWDLLEMASPRYQPRESSEHEAEIEKRELERDRDFLPLGSLEAGFCDWEGFMIGYSLTGLTFNDTRIFGYPYEKHEQEPVELGSSLLETLHTWMTDVYDRAEFMYEDPANQQPGVDTTMQNAREWIEAIEEMQRKLAEHKKELNHERTG